MFVRVKKFLGKHTTRQYLQVVESYREEGKMRQRVLCTLGRVERLQDGGLDGLIQGLAKFSIHGEPFMVNQKLNHYSGRRKPKEMRRNEKLLWRIWRGRSRAGV